MSDGPVRRLEEQIRRHPWVASLLLNALAFGITYGFFEAQFQTNDDTHMMLTAAGISKVTEPSRMLLFTHVFIGEALMALYAGWPAVPWYAMYLVLALYAGHTAILGTALHRRPTWTKLALYLLHYILLGSALLLELQFTIASAVLAIGAFSLLIHLPIPERSDAAAARLRSWLPMLVAVLLALVSGMIRWRSELMMAALFAPILLIVGIGRWRRELAVRAAFFGGALVLSVLVHGIDRQAYENTPGWRDHLEFNELRARHTDYGGITGLPRGERKEALESVGWSPNDALMIEKFFFLDEDVFSLEKLRAMAERLPRAGGMSARQAVLVTGRILLGSPLAVAASLLWLLCVVLADWRWRSLLICLGTPIGVAAVLFGLALTLRAPPERVYWPLLFFMIVPPFLCMAERRTSGGRRALRLGLACLVAAALLAQLPTALSATSSRSTAAKRHHLALRRTMQQLGPRPDLLFVVWGASFPWTAIRPFESASYLSDFRTFTLGSGQRTPDAAKILAEHGIDDLHLSLGQRDDLFFILQGLHANSMRRRYTRFMQQHHGLRVRWELRGRFRGFAVYRIRFEDVVR